MSGVLLGLVSRRVQPGLGAALREDPWAGARDKGSPGQEEWEDQVRGKGGIPAVREPGPRETGWEGTWETDLRGPGVRGVRRPA